MNVLYLILYLLAAVCFIAAAFVSVRPVTNAGPGPARRPLPNLIALGLFLWVLVPLIQTIKDM